MSWGFRSCNVLLFSRLRCWTLLTRNWCPTSEALSCQCCLVPLVPAYGLQWPTNRALFVEVWRISCRYAVHWNSSKADDRFIPLVSCFRAAMGCNSPCLSTLPLASQGLFVGYVQIDPWALDFCSSPCTSWYPRLIWLNMAKWSPQNEVECSNHRKSMPPPVVCPLLLTQSFSIGSFTASKRETNWVTGWHPNFSWRSNLIPFPGNVITSATSMARSTNSWCNLHKLMGQAHKPQCLGKSSLILKPFLSLKAKSKEESMTSPTHTDFACTFGWLLLLSWNEGPWDGYNLHNQNLWHDLYLQKSTPSVSSQVHSEILRPPSSFESWWEPPCYTQHTTWDQDRHKSGYDKPTSLIEDTSNSHPLSSVPISPTQKAHLGLRNLGLRHLPVRMRYFPEVLVRNKSPEGTFYSIFFDMLSTTSGHCTNGFGHSAWHLFHKKGQCLSVESEIASEPATHPKCSLRRPTLHPPELCVGGLMYDWWERNVPFGNSEFGVPKDPIWSPRSFFHNQKPEKHLQSLKLHFWPLEPQGWWINGPTSASNLIHLSTASGLWRCCDGFLVLTEHGTWHAGDAFPVSKLMARRNAPPCASDLTEAHLLSSLVSGALRVLEIYRDCDSGSHRDSPK